jgi:nicotinamidase-related amidase
VASVATSVAVEQLRVGTPAVVVVDAQNDYVHERGAVQARRGIDLSAGRAAVPALNELIRSARRAAVPVIYMRNVHAVVNTLANKRLRRGQGADDLWPRDGSWGADWYEELERPGPDDLVLTKHNYDSFSDTSLSLHLKALGVDTLVVGGFATEVCVETTCRRAFVEGYHVVVPPEVTHGMSQEATTASLRVLDAFFGAVVPLAEVQAAWASRAADRG